MQKKRQVAPRLDESRELLSSIIRFMKLNQQLELQELIRLYTDISPEETVPVSIFAHSLSPSEALCKYLKENCGLSFHEIALLINRDDRSIWTSYSRAASKSKEMFRSEEDDLLIPIAVFQDRSKSVLEHVVHCLKESYELSNSRIARLTNKNPSSIATVARRAQIKQENKEKNG